MRQWQCTAPRWCNNNDGWSKKKKPQWRRKPPRQCRRCSGGAVQATKWWPSTSEVCGIARSCAGRQRRWKIAKVRRCTTKKWGFLTLQRVSTASCSSWTEAYCLTTASVKKRSEAYCFSKKKSNYGSTQWSNFF